MGCPPETGGRAAAMHFARADYDSTPWDGPAAMSKCSNSSTPASCFGSICAARVAGESADTQDGWALPHHKEAGGLPNKAGVSAALGRLNQTDGIDKEKAKAHLDAHAAAWGGGSGAKGAPTMGEVRAMRAAALGGMRRFRPDDGARLATFRADYRHEPVVINGKSLVQLDGYASVVEQEYTMWDMFGPYGETVAASAFDRTLASAPDVAFLVNHKGVTMARTGGSSPTLFLDADPRGLHSLAYVNPQRTDVSDLLTAIGDENVTEMSFAFMIEDWEWDEEYEHVRILEVDLDRGDVSAVNFGANPYTSIGARSQEVMGLLPHLPESVARAAFAALGTRLGVPVGTAERLTATAVAARNRERDTDPAARASGRSIALAQRILDLDDAPGVR